MLKSVNKRSFKNILLFCIFLFLTIVFYFFVSGLSDRKEYKKNSFFYFFHTPVIIKHLAALCQDTPLFIYSAADGPKPNVVVLQCAIGLRELENKLIDENYRKNIIDYSLKDTTIQLEMGRGNDWVSRVVYTESI